MARTTTAILPLTLTIECHCHCVCFCRLSTSHTTTQTRTSRPRSINWRRGRAHPLTATGRRHSSTATAHTPRGRFNPPARPSFQLSASPARRLTRGGDCFAHLPCVVFPYLISHVPTTPNVHIVKLPLPTLPLRSPTAASRQAAAPINSDCAS